MPLASSLPVIEFANPTALALAALIPFVLLLARRRVRTLAPVRRHAVLGLRAMLLLALVVALAEPFTRQPEDRLSVVLILDASESGGGRRRRAPGSIKPAPSPIRATAWLRSPSATAPRSGCPGRRTTDHRPWTVDGGP